MAYETTLECESIIAGVDLSSSQYLLVTYAGTLAVAGERGRSLQNEPKLNEIGSLADRGITKIVLGNTVTVGALLTADANAAAVPATTTGDFVVGTAVTAGVSGDIVSMQAHDCGALAA